MQDITRQFILRDSCAQALTYMVELRSKEGSVRPLKDLHAYPQPQQMEPTPLIQRLRRSWKPPTPTV